MNDPLVNIDADENHFGYDVFQYENVNIYNSENFNELVENNFRQSHNSLSLVHINIRSISRNYDSLSASLATLKLKFDIIALSESWLKDTALDIYFPEYSSYHSIRPARNGGGTALYIRKHLKASIINDLCINNNDIESVFAEISHSGGKVVVGCIYRPPDGNISVFQHEMCSRLSMVMTNLNNILLCGDLNLDMLKIDSNSNIADFYQNMLTYGLIPTITAPTHIYTNRNGVISGSLLDNILTSNQNYYKSGIIEFDITDHNPIFILFTHILDDEPIAETIQYRILNDISIQKFVDKISQTNFDSVVSTDIGVSEAISSLNDKIFEIYNESCPIKTKIITARDKKNPWVTQGVKFLVKQRDHSFRNMKRGITPPEAHRTVRNYVTDRLRVAKKEYFSNLFISLKKNIKKTWKVINDTLKPNRLKKTNCIRKIFYNNVEYEGNLVCQAFNEHFATVGKVINDALVDGGVGCSLQESLSDTIFIDDTTSNEIISIKNGNERLSRVMYLRFQTKF